jgi:hypothetical protein
MFEKMFMRVTATTLCFTITVSTGAFAEGFDRNDKNNKDKSDAVRALLMAAERRT